MCTLVPHKLARCRDAISLSPGSEGVLPGFVEYTYKHILPACFLAPLRATFDLNDGYAFLVSE